MKKNNKILVLALASIALSLTACGNNTSSVSESSITTDVSTSNEDTSILSSEEIIKAYSITYVQNENYVVTFDNIEDPSSVEVNTLVAFSVRGANEEIVINEVTASFIDNDTNENVNLPFINAYKNTYGFEMPNGNVNISITSSVKEYNIAIESSDDVIVNLVDNENNKAKANDTVSFTITSINEDVLINSVMVSDGNSEISYVIDNGVYSFKMPNTDVTILVSSAVATYKVLPSNNPNVRFSLVGTKTEFLPGDEVSFTVATSNGYFLNSVSLKTTDGETVEYTKTSVYSFIMPKSNVIISYEVEEMYQINIEGSDASTILTSDATYYKAGENVSFTVTPDDGYELESVKVSYSGGVVTTSNQGETYSFIMPKGEVTILVETKEISVINNDPFKTKTTFEGTWTYYNSSDYTDYIMDLRVMFNGNNTLSWWLTLDYEEDPWSDWGEYWAIKPKYISKPSDMTGDLKQGEENVSYTYDSVNDQINFSCKFNQSYTDMAIQLIRNGDNVTSIKFTKNLGGEYYQTGNRILNKK